MTIRKFDKFIMMSGFCITMIACQNASVSSYQPKTLDESRIIDVLKQYQKSRNGFNSDSYLSCLHPRGKFSFMGDHILSKQELEKRLPSFWKRLQSGNATVYPIVRESVTGDFFPSWNFSNIKISMNVDNAKVTVICSSSWICRQTHYLSMVKEKDHWIILKTDWRHF